MCLSLSDLFDLLSRVTRVVASISAVFLLVLKAILLYTPEVCHVTFLRSSVDGHWGCVHFGTNRNSAHSCTTFRVDVISFQLSVDLGVELLAHI